MADVAEMIPESASEMKPEEAKEHKSGCDTVETKIVDEKGDAGLPTHEDAAEKIKETKNEVDTTDKPSESCAQETTAETCSAEVAADTTDEAPSGGIKRKSEEDEECSEVTDDTKKVKTDDCKAVSESKDEPVVVMNGSGDNNGCHDNAPDGTNGQTCDDIPPEIVTKSVEEVMQQPDDIAASS